MLILRRPRKASLEQQLLWRPGEEGLEQQLHRWHGQEGLEQQLLGRPRETCVEQQLFRYSYCSSFFLLSGLRILVTAGTFMGQILYRLVAILTVVRIEFYFA
jgi:hypothetical protein